MNFGTITYYYIVFRARHSLLLTGVGVGGGWKKSGLRTTIPTVMCNHQQATPYYYDEIVIIMHRSLNLKCILKYIAPDDDNNEDKLLAQCKIFMCVRYRASLRDS